MQSDFADNYFELFGMEPSIYVDRQMLDDKHRTLQAVLHPDRHINAGSQQRRVAAQKSAFVNEAYRTLLDRCARAVYLLGLKGIVLDTENRSMEAPDFLMEQMELREKMQDGRDDLHTLKDLKRLADDRMTTMMSEFNDAYGADDLPLARSVVGRMQFISKLQSEIADGIRRIHAMPDSA